MKHANTLGCLAVALLAAGLVRAQSPAANPPSPTLLPPVATAPAASIAPPTIGAAPEVASQPGVSSWLAYPRSPSCCGPVGANGPILSEIYSRAGVAFTLGNGVINGRVQQPGLVLGTGARVLLFNPQSDNAWVVDIGVSTITFNDTRPDTVTLRNITRETVVIPELAVIPDGVNQTYFNLSLGKEHYLWGSASCGPETKCRVGWDVGGRYGSCRLDLADMRRRGDVVGGFFLAAHSDLEIPCGCCIWQVGGRAEYGYVWSDVLQSHNNTDLHTISIMATAGLRF